MKIQLKSLLHDLVKERIVENIEETPRKNQVDLEQLHKFERVFTEIMCGLYVRDTDVVGWFTRYSSFQKGCLTNKEFISATEALNYYEEPQMKQQYYDYLVSRQEKAQMLLDIEQLKAMLERDCGMNKGQMVEDVLKQIAEYLTAVKTPIREVFD